MSPFPVDPAAAERLAWLRSRRSVRRFTDQPVPVELLRQVIETATWAPSAHHRQPWRFAALSAPVVLSALAQALAAEHRRALTVDGLPPDEVEAQVSRALIRFSTAPAAVLLCLDMTVMDVYPDPPRQHAEYLMGVQSVALAGGTLLLAAHACGLGGVWVCAPLFAPAVVRQVLNLPETWQPQGLLLLGYPQLIPAPRSRRAIEEVARFYE